MHRRCRKEQSGPTPYASCARPVSDTGDHEAAPDSDVRASMKAGPGPSVPRHLLVATSTYAITTRPRRRAVTGASVQAAGGRSWLLRGNCVLTEASVDRVPQVLLLEEGAGGLSAGVVAGLPIARVSAGAALSPVLSTLLLQVRATAGSAAKVVMSGVSWEGSSVGPGSLVECGNSREARTRRRPEKQPGTARCGLVPFLQLARTPRRVQRGGGAAPSVLGRLRSCRLPGAYEGPGEG
jgi:hypothetical protein